MATGDQTTHDRSSEAGTRSSPRVTSVTTQWAWSQLAFSQNVLRENLLVMRLICTILCLALGQQFSCFLNKEIVPGTVHQSKAMGDNLGKN